MLLETFKNFSGFELLDTGDGFRLERWGEVILARPDPQIIWKKSLPETEWQKAWAIYKPGHEGKGSWEINRALPKPWLAQFGDVKFLLKPSPFKHTGLFAEQAANWEWMLNLIKNKKGSEINILNLFGYTGGATAVLAKAGALVTHVDASRPAISWAKENAELNKLPVNAIRWMLDDAVKFVQREVRRGKKYHGIIMDPPAFGHSPSGKTWKFNEDLPGLLTDCVSLLNENALFLIINGYATNSSALAINNLLEDNTKNLRGQVEFGELCLKQKSGRIISTGIFSRWSK